MYSFTLRRRRKLVFILRAGRGASYARNGLKLHESIRNFMLVPRERFAELRNSYVAWFLTERRKTENCQKLPI